MATIFAFLVMALAGADGILLMRLYLPDASVKLQLNFGIVLGIVALAWTGFLSSLCFGLNWISIGVTIAIFVVCLVVLLTRSFLQTRMPKPREVIDTRSLTVDVSFYVFWVLLFVWMFSSIIVVETDGLYTSPATNYGDLAFHFSVITSFSEGDNFPPQNPIFQGLKFTYPFLIDFLTAFLHRIGAGWIAAFFIPNIILIVALIGLIEVLTEQLTASKSAARIAPILFFFSGGLGFIYCFQDWSKANFRGWDFLQHLPQSYTKNDALNLQWSNLLTTLIIPQRSLLFGIPVFAMIVILWRKYLNHRGESIPFSNIFSTNLFRSERKCLLLAGFLAGVMPMLHAHGFFAVMLVSVVLALTFFSWDWIAFFIPAGILSLPQAWWLSGTGTRSSLFTFNFGWMPSEASLVKFYALNFGLLLFLLVPAVSLTSARTRRFYWPFIICFIIPNVVLLAPWPWDNIKVLLYWYLVSCALVAGLIARFWTRKLFPIGIFLIILLTLSGALDVVRALSPIEKLRLFDADQLKVAELIKQRIPPQALMLSAPIHNSVLALSGRPNVMGYPGHLWSHGVKFEERERDVKAIYLGGEEAATLLKKYAIDFVVVGPVETQDLNADEGFFAERFAAVIDENGYRVYKIR